MGNLNKVLIIGHLGQDPEKKVTANGNSVVNISIAVTEKFNDKSGNKQEKTEWVRAIFWNKQAELVAQYCKKGSQLYVEGALQTREWDDKDGNKRSTTEVICRNMQFLDSKGTQNYSNQPTGNQQRQAQDQRPPQNGQDPNHFIDDSIPF